MKQEKLILKDQIELIDLINKKTYLNRCEAMTYLGVCSTIFSRITGCLKQDGRFSVGGKWQKTDLDYGFKLLQCQKVLKQQSQNYTISKGIQKSLSKRIREVKSQSISSQTLDTMGKDVKSAQVIYPIFT